MIGVVGSCLAFGGGDRDLKFGIYIGYSIHVLLYVPYPPKW